MSARHRGHRTPLRVAGTGACALALAVAASGQETGRYGGTLEREKLEEFLRVADVVDRESIGVGVTGSERLTLSDGTETRHATWKTIDVHEPGLWRGTRGEIQFDFRDSWRNEVAAYELDKLLGLGLVPPAVRRRIDGRLGSVQLWVEGTMTELDRRERRVRPEAVAGRRRWHNQWHCIRLLQQLSYNTDRQNLRNVLVDPEFGLYAIDFSRAFRIQPELLAPDDLVCFSRRVVERLRRLDRSAIEERMGDLLDEMQVDGLLERRDRILGVVEARVEENGQGQTFFY